MQGTWRHVHLWLGDERCVPADHEDANQRMIRESLLDKLRASDQPTLHPVRGELTPEDAAWLYGCAVTRAMGEHPVFDLVLLGLGPDGHICSLFAGVPGSAERGDDELVRHVAAPVNVEPKVARITLLPFLVVTARMVVLQVTGAAKADVLARALKGPEDLAACPAQWLRKASGRVVVACDSPASSRL